MFELVLENFPLVLTAIGLVLIALEALSPGAHLIVVGISLLGAGLAGLFATLLFGVTLGPIVLAAVALGVGVVAAYAYRELDLYGGKGQAQTMDSSSLAGATGYATESITTRSGAVKIDGGGFNPHYSARTESGTIPEGQDVIVVDPGGGNVVTVEPLGTVEADEIDRALARDAATRGGEESDGEDTDSGAPDRRDSDATASEAETEETQ